MKKDFINKYADKLINKFNKKYPVKSCANCTNGNEGNWWYCNKGWMMICGNKEDKPKWSPKFLKEQINHSH